MSNSKKATKQATLKQLTFAQKLVVAALLIYVCLLAIAYILSFNDKQRVGSYKDCVRAGQSVRHTYPDKSCLTSDGRVFTDKLVQEGPPHTRDVDKRKVLGIIRKIDYDRGVGYIHVPIEVEVDANDKTSVTYYASTDETACDVATVRQIKSRELQIGDIVEVEGKLGVVDRPLSESDIFPYEVCREGTFIKKLDLTAL